MFKQQNVVSNKELKIAKTEEEKMAIAEEKLQNMNLSSDFLFGNVMLNEEICRSVLETIIDSDVGELEFSRSQVEINTLIDYRSVRFDIVARDSKGTIYNLEMQTSNNDDLLKRIRYYQAKMDSVLLPKGSNTKYADLPKSYIIFICTFDYFGKNLYRYTRRTSITETQDGFDDGTTIIIINTKGTVRLEGVSKSLVAFSNYVNNSSDENAKKLNDELVNELHKVVKTVKESKEKVRQLKIFGELLDKEREEGIQQGKIEVALNLIKKRKYDDEEIAELSELPIEMIVELRNQQ